MPSLEQQVCRLFGPVYELPIDVEDLISGRHQAKRLGMLAHLLNHCSAEQRPSKLNPNPGARLLEELDHAFLLFLAHVLRLEHATTWAACAWLFFWSPKHDATGLQRCQSAEDNAHVAVTHEYRYGMDGRTRVTAMHTPWVDPYIGEQARTCRCAERAHLSPAPRVWFFTHDSHSGER